MLAERRKGDIAEADLADVRAGYEQGLYLQAYARAEALAPLRAWRGTSARVLAGRIAANLGGARLADWHFVRAWRADPHHAEALWYYANYLASQRGPWRAWRFLK